MEREVTKQRKRLWNNNKVQENCLEKVVNRGRERERKEKNEVSFQQ